MRVCSSAPETVAEERRREEAARVKERCDKLVEDVYKGLGYSFKNGSKKVTTRANVSETVLECAKKRLENDGLTVTYYQGSEYANGQITAEYKK